MEPKGRSTLSKLTYGCQNIRVGTKEFSGKCTKPKCGHVFVKDDGKTHIVFETAPDNSQLVKEAYKTLINLAAIDRKGEDGERLDRLQEKAEERLFRRLDKLV